MATGVGMGFDLEGLDKAIKNAEKGFDNLIKKGQKTQEAIVNNFRIMAEEGVGYFASKLNGISSAFENFGKSASKGMQDIASSSSSAVDKVNHLIDMVKSLSYSDYKGQSYSSGAVAKLTYEIEEAMKKLAQLQEKLNFYATGEGAKAIGFYDTSKIVEEANALQRYIELLQQERHELQQIANIKGFQAEQQAKIDAEWQRMEDERIENIRESAKVSSEAAKAESVAWKQSYEEAYRAYEKLFDKADEREYAELFKKAEANLRQMQKAEAERYSDWLLQKKREEDEHKRIEDEKYKSTVEAIAKQNAAYAELENRRQQNQQVRDNAVQARANYEATIRMYEQMYAQIDAKEKEKERRYLETQKREEEAAARKAKSVIDQANRELEAYRNAYKQRQQMYEQMWREIERRESSNRRGDYQNAMLGGAGGIKSADSALRYADRIYSDRGLRSVNNMQKAIQQMQQAQQRLNLNTEQGRQKYKQLDEEIKRVKSDIDRVTGASENLNKTHKGLLDTSGQLARAMAAMFSVSAIKGYVNKLTQIRGEFELQQRSLQVLLQNKDEANALWDKTVALAVKSPYTTKQLVTATKQLAAYRVESEKLYETNKMLADVSIGLGVDMNRLILAFGQVKAANFLRGTELRQFSEAGVNMLDELAKRFTDIEGRAVSVAEVFDRISKRKVTFADVEAVFKEITSEGGMFYQMQEKQAETLKGQILNLRDSYELLLNSIGKKQEGAIKDVISSIKSLIDNWETYANIIKPLLTFIIARFGIIKAQAAFKFMTEQIGKFKDAMQEAEGGVKGFFAAFKKGMKTNWLGIILTIVATLVELFDGFTSVSDAAGGVAKSLAEFRSETDELIKNFEKYTDVLRDNTKTTDEQDEAVKRLRSGYKELIGEHNLEKEKLIEVSKEREKYIAILEKQRRLQEKQRMYDFVQNEYKVDTEALKDLFAIFEKLNKDFTPVDAFKKIEDLKKEIIEGTKTSEEAIVELKKYFAHFSGTGFNDFEEGLFTGGLLPVIKGDAGLKDAISAYTKAAFNPLDAYNFISGLSGIEDLFKSLGDVTIEYADAQDTATKRFNEFKSSLGDLTPTSMAALGNLIGRIKYEIKKVGNESTENALLSWLGFNNIKYKSELEDLTKEISQPINKAVVEVYDGVKEKNEELAKTVSESFLSGMLKGFNESTVDFKKRWDEAYDAAQNTVKEHKQGGIITSLLISEEELNEAKFVIAVYEQLFGKSIKEKDINSTFDKRLQVIKELHKAYKDLSKTLSDVEAKEGALVKYGNAFKEAFGKTVEEMGFDLYSENGLLSAIDYLIDNAPNVAKRIQAELAKGEITWETKIEVKQESDEAFSKSIEDMFGDYELSLELEKLNIPKDLASRLFGIEDIDLSDIRKRIEQEIYNAQLKGGQEDFIAKRKEELEKVKDMEIKQQRELLKTYSKYLVQAQSERIKIKLDELRQLKEIESLEIGDADKALMRQGVQKDIQKRLDTQAWKDFQESGMYVRLFDNLEGASMHSLDKMENALMSLRDSLKDLDPSELKEINNQLEKIRDIKVDKNPFRGLADDAKTYFEYVKNRKEWEASLDASEAKEADLRSEADEQSLYIKSLEDEIDLIDQSTIEGENLAIDMADRVELEKEYLKVLLDELEAQGKITKEERARIEKGQNAGKSMQDRLSKTAQVISAVTSSMADMATNLEAAFGMSDSLKDTFELLQGIGGGVSDLFSGAAGLFSGNPLEMISGGMQLVSGVSKIFASFNEAHDKRIERKIEREIKLVERLGKLYEKLEKQIESAYSIDTFKAANDAAKENLEQQIRATERMIEAEEDKKDTDHKRIEEWREQIDENLEMLEELEEKRLQELGGVGGEDYYKDTAQEFVDAWLEAFYETGDGLTALEDEFDEVMKNLVKKQVLQRVAGALLQPLLTSIDTAVGNDGLFDEKEFAATMELAKQIFPDFNEKMKQTIEEMGMTDWAGKNAELGSLSAGIQGISETQADTISAYLNSIRFIISDSNIQLKTLVEMQAGLSNITTSEMSKAANRNGVWNNDEDTANPMLPQLRMIAVQTTAINELLQGLVRGGHSMGGTGLKVFIS